MRPTRALRSLLFLVPLVFQFRAASAQRYWHDEQGRDAIRLDLGKPFLKGEGEKFPTGSIVPSLSMRAVEAIRVEADLPLMRAGFDFGTPTGTSSAFRIGNPYLGLRIGDDEKLITGTIGFRLPLASKPDTPIAQQAVRAGAITTFDEFEAFAPNFLTVRSSLEAHWVSDTKVLLGAKAGPSLLMSTDGDPNKQSDIFFDYGGRIGYEASGAQMTVALTGRYLITPADKAFERCTPVGCEIERFHHAASATVELRSGALRPRVSVRLPFDKDLRDQAGTILTVGLSFAH